MIVRTAGGLALANISALITTRSAVEPSTSLTSAGHLSGLSGGCPGSTLLSVTAAAAARGCRVGPA
ncbi:MAG: hypothetical protein WKF83_09900 [Nocardioidaceae bacterium]